MINIKVAPITRTYDFARINDNDYIIVHDLTTPKIEYIVLDDHSVLFTLLEMDPLQPENIIVTLNNYFQNCIIGFYGCPTYDNSILINYQDFTKKVMLLKCIVETISAIQSYDISSLLDWYGGICRIDPHLEPNDWSKNPINCFLLQMPKSYISVAKIRDTDWTVVRHGPDDMHFGTKFPFSVDYLQQVPGVLFSKRRFLASIDKIKEKKLFEYALSGCVDLINMEIKSVAYHLSGNLNKKNEELFTGAWYAKDVFSAAYFELYQNLVDAVPLKKCANPTCRKYFEIYSNDRRKKYCSTRCAQLEAKRKQRMRDKLK